MYQTEKIQVSIEHIPIELLQITNIDALFEALLQQSPDDIAVKDERIPYWAELWPSAIAMSRYLVRNQLINKDLFVLEIGCGLGLPGIVAGKYGAKTTLTDYLPEALEFAKQNWALNNATQANFQVLDWREPIDIEPADLLLASDVAYEARLYKYLPDAFRKLCKPNGKIILSEPNRPFSKDFLRQLPQQGFDVKTSSEIVAMHEREYIINVLEITLR